MQQAITWTIVDQDLFCYMASLSDNDFRMVTMATQTVISVNPAVVIALVLLALEWWFGG